MTSKSDTPIATEDRLAIVQLFARYSWAFDARDGDAYADVFMPEGIMEGGPRRMQGREELKAFVARFADAPASQHWVTNTMLTGSRETGIQARSYLVEFEVDESGPRLALVGQYHDSLVHDGSAWRIAHRRFVAIG
ncbi:nuclear transport factor 2 family protein [Nocardioides sp.]|uniref:nuclear transport factor 2 family protein n=1 Tax=Nocardioides sp. TaxID=35761 RepID=UPI003D10D15A